MTVIAINNYDCIGKIEKEIVGKGKGHASTKQDRRNTANQLKKNKIIESTISKKLFSGRNGISKVVTLIPLSGNIDSSHIIQSLSEQLGLSNVTVNAPGLTTIFCERFKQNLTFVVPIPTFTNILDAAKVADFVVFGISATEEVPAFGELCIKAIESQGVSNVYTVVPDLDKIEGTKTQGDVKSSLFSYFTYYFSDLEKVYATDSSSDMMHLSRSLCQKTPKGVSWRDERSYLLATKYYWEADTNSETGGYLVAEGTVRGQGMNPDRLVHITDRGDFQIEKVLEITHGESVEDSLYLPTEEKDNLEQLAPYDDDMEDDIEPEDQDADLGVRLDGHKYFRNEFKEEMEHKLKARKLPAGMSEYQSRWIIDDEDIEDDEEHSDEDVMEQDEEDEFGVGEPSEYDPTEAGDLQSEMFIELTEEEEEKQLKEFRQRAKDELNFPDEIELPPTSSAKDRLMRYRGLKSLRSCAWDADEKDGRAPEEWKRLARVQNFRGTRNRVLKEASQSAKIQVGKHVRVYIKADQGLFESLSSSMLVLYGLLQHEHKLAVVNLTVQHNTDYEEPVAAKETLIAQCGPRRLVIQPVFSQSGNTDNNVYKYQRFMYPGDTVTATVIAPLMFGSLPVLLFKSNGGQLKLVGTGSVLNADHSRILAKRAILTGHPFKIHKKVVTIRYMFFNRDDIQWFKAVPLFTRMGNSGYIREPLGTHGYFKASFDRKINPQDTVAMALYKRVWPKVSTLWNGELSS